MPTRRTGPSFHLLVLTAVILLAGAVEGCYTLVRHPGIARLNYARPSSETPCIQCHTSGQRLAYVSSHGLDRARGPWGGLDDPWWFDAADTVRSDGGGTR
jgi:hypothetical protein